MSVVGVVADILKEQSRQHEGHDQSAIDTASHLCENFTSFRTEMLRRLMETL